MSRVARLQGDLFARSWCMLGGLCLQLQVASVSCLLCHCAILMLTLVSCTNPEVQAVQQAL